MDLRGENNRVGGTTAAARNVISGNELTGLVIGGSPSEPATGTVVQGNYVGTDASGTAAIGNVVGVALVFDVSGVLVGGNTPAERNVISGNSVFQVQISYDSNFVLNPTNNRVEGNFIGTDVSGTNPIGGSNFAAVHIQTNPDSGNVIGGTAPGTGNTIAFNTSTGVWVQFGSGNAILGNSIFSNSGLGIDLGPSFVELNDPGDGDSGANNLQNYPELTSASSSGGSTTVQGTLNSEPTKTYRLEFFSNDACDFPMGWGEGQRFLGFQDVTTDGSGNATFTATLPSGVSSTDVVTSTATAPGGNTSEFSQCASVTSGPGPPATLSLSPDTATNEVDSEHCVTAAVGDSAGAPGPT